jgi:putative membrane protein
VTDRPFDPGLQPERTLLAWRRTALALGVGSAVGARLALPVLGSGAVVVGVLGVLAALVSYVAASRRYHRAHRALTSGDRLPTGGAPLAVTAGAVGALALAAMAYVLSLALAVRQ